MVVVGVHLGLHVVVDVAGGVYFGFVVDGSAGAEPKSQLPYISPADDDAKKLKRPGEKSRAPYGHPAHCALQVR